MFAVQKLSAPKFSSETPVTFTKTTVVARFFKWGGSTKKIYFAVGIAMTSSFQNSIITEIDQIIFQNLHFVAFQSVVFFNPTKPQFFVAFQSSQIIFQPVLGDLVIYHIPKCMLCIHKIQKSHNSKQNTASKACLTLTYASCEPPWRHAE